MPTEIKLIELEAEIEIILRSLRVGFKKTNTVKDVSVQFICEDFGVIVNAINRSDYVYINKITRENFPNYRYMYISTFDDLLEAKEELIWTLMQSGYMKFIRMNFIRQFTELVVNGFGNKIIDERLKRWGDQPKFKFFVEENKEARQLPVTMVLATEPAFFDMMP
jgi:hypothetical protein